MHRPRQNCSQCAPLCSWGCGVLDPKRCSDLQTHTYTHTHARTLPLSLCFAKEITVNLSLDPLHWAKLLDPRLLALTWTWFPWTAVPVHMDILPVYGKAWHGETHAKVFPFSQHKLHVKMTLGVHFLSFPCFSCLREITQRLSCSGKPSAGNRLGISSQRGLLTTGVIGLNFPSTEHWRYRGHCERVMRASEFPRRCWIPAINVLSDEDRCTDSQNRTT